MRLEGAGRNDIVIIRVLTDKGAERFLKCGDAVGLDLVVAIQEQDNPVVLERIFKLLLCMICYCVQYVLASIHVEGHLDLIGSNIFLALDVDIVNIVGKEVVFPVLMRYTVVFGSFMSQIIIELDIQVISADFHFLIP